MLTDNGVLSISMLSLGGYHEESLPPSDRGGVSFGFLIDDWPIPWPGL